MTELEAHELVRDALNAGLRNPNFFVWLNVVVEDPGGSADILDLEDLVRRTDQWLEGLDPDAAPGERGSELVREYSPVRIRLRAGAWKPEARGRHHSEKVGPAVPVIAFWT